MLSNWKFGSLVFIFPIMLYSYAHLIKLQPFLVEGIVINLVSRQPVINAYLYIIKGEEEAITNIQGRFKIESWQKIPFTLTVEHKGYEIFRVLINDTTKKNMLLKIKPLKQE